MKQTLGKLHLKRLKIGSFNCQGIKTKIEDPVFRDEIKKFDMFAVNETWITKENKNIFIENYKFFPASRNKEMGKIRGGIGWFVYEKLRKWIKIMYDISNETFLWCKLDKTFFNFDDDLFVCSVYIPPEYSSREKRLKKDHFKLLLETIRTLKSTNIILIGDFNSRTKLFEDILQTENEVDEYIPRVLISDIKRKRANQDKKGNKYGKKLTDLCLTSKLYIANGRTLGDLNGKFTCFEKNGTSTVDYAIISENLNAFIHSFSITDPFLGSDHCILKLTVSLPKEVMTNGIEMNKDIPKIKWNEENKNNFLQYIILPSTILKIEEVEKSLDNNIDQAINKLNEIYTTSNKLLYKRRSNKLIRSCKNKKWYDYTCYEMSKRLKLISKLVTKSPFNPYLRGSLVTTKKEYNKLIKYKKREWKNEMINKLENMESKNSKEYWNLIEKIKGEKERKNISDPEYFQNFFKKIYSEETCDMDDFHKNIKHEVNELLKHDKSNRLFDAEITIDEVKKYIKELKNNKAGGPDGIIAEMIKSTPDNIITIITRIMNKIIKSSIYPKDWCMGTTSLIFKDGDEENPNNYRTINVGNILPKLFMSIINSRVTKLLTENKAIGDYQIGFKRNSRTADHVYVLKSIIDKYVENGKKLYTCFIDFQKAFDSVWREGLYYKMLKLGITPNIVKIVKDMYDKNTQCLKLNGLITDQFPSTKGVKQGCTLSPTLFNIFINDFHECINHPLCHPISLNNERMNCLMYAGDIVILSESKEGLQECLKNVYDYNRKWHLNINIKKTKLMTSRNKVK